MKSHLGFNCGLITSRSSRYQREKISEHPDNRIDPGESFEPIVWIFSFVPHLHKAVTKLFLHALIFFSHFPCHLWVFFFKFQLLCGKNKQFLCWTLWKSKNCCFVTVNENVNVYVKKHFGRLLYERKIIFAFSSVAFLHTCEIL